MNKKDKKEKLEETFALIDRMFGKGAIFKYGDGIKSNVKGVISTGSLTLDAATGIDGVPFGRIIEIFGKESSGKTTLALHIIAEAQKAGYLAAFIDAEHALDPGYASSIGVDMPNLLMSQPDNGEMALEITEKLAASGNVGVIVIDSVAALVPKAEIEGEMGDAQMGSHARLMSQAMRKLSAIVSKSNCLVVFINQTRIKIGVMFGNPETTTGGNALKFFASMRFNIKYIGAVEIDKEKIASKTKVIVVKNKMAVPFQIALFEIRYGVGIDKYTEIIDLAIEYDFIKKSGTWYSYGDERIGQGKEAVRKLMIKNESLYNAVRKKLLGET